MRRTTAQLALAMGVIAAFSGSDWLHFRGTDNRSVSEEKNLPKSFSDEENVAWKAPLPVIADKSKQTLHCKGGHHG